MTKADEIKILRATALQLGAESYCGNWLLSVLAEVERDIKSDLAPAITISETALRCKEMEKRALARYKDIIIQADNYAATTTTEARQTAERIRRRYAAQLREVLRVLEEAL